MFRCECGAEFDDPCVEREYRGEYWGTPAYETMYYCPVCGSSSFDEIREDEEDDE